MKIAPIIKKRIEEKFENAKAFRKALKEKLGKKFDVEKMKTAMTKLDVTRNVITTRNAIKDLLGNDVYDCGKAATNNKTEKTKAVEAHDKKILLMIEGFKDGEIIPKTVYKKINLKKNSVSFQANVDSVKCPETGSKLNWTVSVSDEIGTLIEMQTTEKDKEILRSCRRITAVLIAE